jgi:hypothetical protein
MCVEWFGEVVIDVKPTVHDWKKWRPIQPTNALWYQQRHLERLIGACIGHDQATGSARTVSDFIKTFDGLSGTKKRREILDATGLSRQPLDSLVGDGGLDSAKVGQLLSEMQSRSKEVKPPRLGIIGKDHFTERLGALGCDADQVEYRKVSRVDDGIPFVIESAFGWLGADTPDRRQLFIGANWSSAIKNPLRSFGSTGRGLESQLAELHVGPTEPVVFALHLAHPRIEYTDHGKSAISIDSDGTEAKHMEENWS